jgi:hypothetical protein
MKIKPMKVSSTRFLPTVITTRLSNHTKVRVAIPIETEPLTGRLKIVQNYPDQNLEYVSAVSRLITVKDGKLIVIGGVYVEPGEVVLSLIV